MRTPGTAVRRACMAVLAMNAWLADVEPAAAHHVLGRPAYSLSEDSNTPPSIQAEVLIGDYTVTYMVFPAFPKPGRPGRINLHVRRSGDGTPFAGEVTFTVRHDSWWEWLGADPGGERLGTRPPDDNVFRQGFLFHEAGDFIISARFEAGGEPHVVDFPLRVGAPAPVGPIGVVVGLTLFGLIGISVVQRRRAMTGKIRAAHDQARRE